MVFADGHVYSSLLIFLALLFCLPGCFNGSFQQHEYMKSLSVLSDIHYAGPQEQKCGSREGSVIRNPLLRLLVKIYRNYFWLREPTRQNHLLDEFFRRVSSVDFVVADGNSSCDTSFIGLSDDAAFESARLCLDQLKKRFPLISGPPWEIMSLESSVSSGAGVDSGFIATNVP